MSQKKYNFVEMYPHIATGEVAYNNYKTCVADSTRIVQNCLEEWAKEKGLKVWGKDNCLAHEEVKKETSKIYFRPEVKPVEREIITAPTTESCKIVQLNRTHNANSYAPNEDTDSRFVDLPVYDYYYPFAVILDEQGILDGKANSGVIAVSENIKRAEFSKMVALAKSLKIKSCEKDSKQKYLIDVDANVWYRPYIQALIEEKLLVPENGMVRPAENVTYGEALEVLSKAFYFSELNAKRSSADYYESLLFFDLIPESLVGEDNWNKPLTRGEMIELLTKVLEFVDTQL